MKTSAPPSRYRIAIACGGTGGHLFPGLAIANELRKGGCEITLIVSEKEIDQVALQSGGEFHTLRLPAVGLTARRAVSFVSGFFRAYGKSRQYFQDWKPDAVLAMGGFTGAPAVVAGKRAGARLFLHESNTIPGRANRWLSTIADLAFAGFNETKSRFRKVECVVTGTPVRSGFQPRDPSACKQSLGIAADGELLLAMGGSQGARAINDLAVQAMPMVLQRNAQLQVLHLAGAADADRTRAAYKQMGARAQVRDFLGEMDLALGAATLAVSRAGASSLAELAASQVPAILVPFPAATDNHQWHNAQAFAQSGAAVMLEQKQLCGGRLASEIHALLSDAGKLASMRTNLAKWHNPAAASMIAELMLRTVQGEPVRNEVGAQIRLKTNPVVIS